MKRTNAVLILFSLFWIFAASGFAQDYTSIYSINTLQKAYQTYGTNLQGVWEVDLKTRLPAGQKRAAADVRMLLPDIGQHLHPLDFYAEVGARRVTIPIFSVKFFDDICIALAWFERNGCDNSWVSDYVGMLRYQHNQSFSGWRYPDPLYALKIPQNALDDHFVNDVSGKALKSGIYFLMAHELAHILYAHKGYDEISPARAKLQETEADNFALNLMRRISVPPVGISFFFLAASRFEPAPGDFDSMPAYESYLRQHTKHPLTSARLINIADYIRDHVHDFSAGQDQPALWNQRIISISENIRRLGTTLDDGKIRDRQRQRSLTVTVNQLRGACP